MVSHFTYDTPETGMREISSEPTASENIPVDMPRHIRVDDLGNRLLIHRRWFTLLAFVVLFFAIAWNGFLVFWYSMALALGGGNLLMLLFPLIHVTIGIGISYFALCLFFNTTTISLDPNELRIRHHPLPWPGSRGYDPAQISQLFSKRRVVTYSQGGSSVSYEVHAVMIGGKRKKLLGSLPQYEQARYIEQRLEQAMGITDQPVDGQVRD